MGYRTRGRGYAGVSRAALVGALAAGVAACSSSDGLSGSSRASPPAAPASSPAPSSQSGSFTDRMNALFFGAPARPGEGTKLETPGAEAGCPSVDVRSGASTLAVSAPGAEATATNLRYQASIAQTARECVALGATMTIKVGVQGRVILGPTGAPGQLDVPLRLALVREGVEPKTIWTKLYRVAVTVAPGQTNVPFVQVEEDLTFPMPKVSELEAYVVYVGFDPAGQREPPPRRAPAKKAR